MNKSKLINFMMASVIFIVAVIELYSWYLCVSENYTGDIKASNYFLYDYPQLNSYKDIIIASYFLFKTFQYKLCIYTVIVTWIYFLIQAFNLFALEFSIGWDAYNFVIYPLLLSSIMGITLLKFCRSFYYR